MDSYILDGGPDGGKHNVVKRYVLEDICLTLAQTKVWVRVKKKFTATVV